MQLVWLQIFKAKKIPEEKAPCKCLSITILDSAIKAKKKYYAQTFLEEYKYEAEKVKMENLIDDDSEKSSSDESDNDSNDEQNLLMKNVMTNLQNNFLKVKKVF